MRKRSVGKKFAVCAALFALLIQFVASFGHIHLDYSVRPDAAASARAIHPDTVTNPIDNDSDEHLADICGICATLNLIAAGQIASPPALPLQEYDEAQAPKPAQIMLAGIRHLNFRSRAPPFA
ncbi:MAG TPA: hypothetical protein VEJ43_15970 [Pseudolabrys sp.]|nr:hypothetical protein [Pseudolabrys sp.]